MGKGRGGSVGGGEGREEEGRRGKWRGGVRGAEGRMRGGGTGEAEGESVEGKGRGGEGRGGKGGWEGEDGGGGQRDVLRKGTGQTLNPLCPFLPFAGSSTVHLGWTRVQRKRAAPWADPAAGVPGHQDLVDKTRVEFAGWDF